LTVREAALINVRAVVWWESEIRIRRILLVDKWTESSKLVAHESLIGVFED